MHKPLTRAEAEARAALLDVQSYDVDLDLTRGHEIFGSRSVIRFSGRPGQDTFAEIRPAVLHRAALNGRELDPAALRDGRLPLTGVQADNELLLEADMRYTHTGEGMHRFTDPADGEVYVYTQCGPAEAARIFGCFDQPDLKAVVRVGVTAPAHWTVVGNAAVASVGGGRWDFAPTAPVSTYLVAVAGGPLHSVRTSHDGIPLGLYARRSLAAQLDAAAEEILDTTARSFDRYHELFTERYAFGKYDQVFVPELNWGAVENPGCVTFNDNFLFRGQATYAERMQRAVVVAHELAHMWFGDLVTMRWWDDLWLNESFAEYMGYKVVSEVTGFRTARTAFAIRKAWGYDADQRTSTHPVAGQSIDDAAAALANFDGISYAKGAAALGQLVTWVGEANFLAAINDHFARHRFGNATLADLVAALTETSGRDVRSWTEAWLRTSGVDTLRLTVDGTTAVLAGGSRPHRILVGGYDLRDGRLVLRERGETETGPLPWLVDGPRPDLVLPNDQDLGYLKVRLDPRSWETVTSYLSTIDDPLNRAVLWNLARDLVRDAELPVADYLDVVGSQLPSEPDVSLAAFVLRFARREVAGRYVDPARHADAVAALAVVCRKLLASGGGVRPGAEGMPVAATRELVECTADADELRGWLAAGRVTGGAELDPELRWTVLRRLSAIGSATESDLATELTRDPSAAGREAAAYCRAARPEAAAKQQAWRLLFGDSALSKPLLASTADGFWQPDQQDLTAEFVPRYFTEVLSAGDRGLSVAEVLGGRAFPRYAADPATIGLAEACLRRTDLAGAVRRALSDQLDDLRRAARVRSAR
ncbi:MAG TPA: aminopeptidase N [Kribbellaceae bacterium]|nr:aminopeptidase N [Kribbellaceae bacterium]